MPTLKKIPVPNLLVNPQNDRYEPVANQKEAIDEILKDQKLNLVNLAEHIVANGLDPYEKLKVLQSNHDPKKFIVLEGNRRTVTLKLLHNPDLIEGIEFAAIKRKFKKLNEENKGKLISQIECVVYEDSKDADKWIGLKHGYGPAGVSTNSWDPLQKDRFAQRTEGVTSTALQVINLIKKSDNVPADIRDNVNNIKATNLTRLLDDPDVRDFLGIEFNEGNIQSDLDPKEVIKGLTHVVKTLLHKDFKVGKIYTKEDRKDFVKAFPKNSIPNKINKAPKPWLLNSKALTQPTAAKSTGKRIPKDRTTLMPKNLVMKINNPKINDIYHEFLRLDITKFTNAGAVLFRVFMELSVDSYIDHHKIAGAGVISSAKSGMNFQQKVNTVANHLQTKGLADTNICQGIKNEIKEKNGILEVDTLNGYVHNNKLSPKADNLIKSWNNIQDFMIILWNNVN